MTEKKKDWLRVFNNALSLVVLVLALYIIVLPFLPNLQFWVKKTTNAYPELVKQNLTEEQKEDEVIPEENTLVVPSLGMQELVHLGATSSALEKGVWHRPNTSVPSESSNTVLVGHRFTYTQPQGVFYHLDKVKVGDRIVLYWEGEKYSYKVAKVFVVPADRVQIEDPTAEPMLTLYTCTPLWSAKERLVIQAPLEES